MTEPKPPPPRPPKITNKWISSGDTLRFDRIQTYGNGTYSSGQGNQTITWEQSQTWELDASIQLTFDFLNASFGGSYSQEKSFSVSVELDLATGQRGRAAFIPNYRFIDSQYTEQAWDLENGWVTIYDHVPIRSWFPIDGGVDYIQFSQPAFYAEPAYQSNPNIPTQAVPWIFDKGRYNRGDVGSFDNDSISSMSVPEGYTVELFMDAGFTGKSVRLGSGEYPYFSPEWDKQTSSIIIS